MNPEEFRRIRKAARMTQAQMAERLDVSRKTIVNWEGGIFAIPDDALVTLQERGVADAPEVKPITPKTYPELYRPGKLKNTFLRNHLHPHWYVTCTSLLYHMTEEQIDFVGKTISMTADLENTTWTPERAIAFIMRFDSPRCKTRMSKERAHEIAHIVGFDVPVARDPYLVAQQEHFRDPNATLETFYATYPQFKPKPPEGTGEIDPDLKQAFETAFHLKTAKD